VGHTPESGESFLGPGKDARAAFAIGQLGNPLSPVADRLAADAYLEFGKLTRR